MYNKSEPGAFQTQEGTLNILLNPNVSFLLLVIGIVVAVLALFSPGTMVLEGLAITAIGLAIYGIANLSINFWALLILVIGVFPFLILFRWKKHWLFLVPALLALIVGTSFLLVNPNGTLAVYPVISIPTSAFAAGILWVFSRRALEAMALLPSFDLNTLTGKTGIARTDIYQEGSVYVGSEVWTARSRLFVPAGAEVRITGREGLVLTVEPVPAAQDEP
jgi:membrane-bound serine protease (ClpP class)